MGVVFQAFPKQVFLGLTTPIWIAIGVVGMMIQMTARAIVTLPEERWQPIGTGN